MKVAAQAWLVWRDGPRIAVLNFQALWLVILKLSLVAIEVSFSFRWATFIPD